MSSLSNDEQEQMQKNLQEMKQFIKAYARKAIFNKEQVTIKRHVLIGDGAVIMPGVVISEGTSIGAMSFVICP